MKLIHRIARTGVVWPQTGIAAALLLVLGACTAYDDTGAPPVQADAGTTGASVASPPPLELSANELAALVEAGEVLFLDVRPAEEISEVGTVAGSVSIPIDELPDRLDELPRDRRLVAL